ncbi:VOC family protein [[Mycobacterium] wendilense]|uniref:VOC family protein n=1 Tax=[Mycobacterium] wendilense TaxID=3064284 RepID=A0ABN9P8K1_9MYCO|nr:VOC family protein [Mycolicibacterium sp. MU0050]CAJ1584811.1 VOC family protein [Mycolicibacterium sp. MU0050]
MSIIFGPARQNGLVVANLDEAVQRWVDKLGAGPFFVVRHLPLDYFTYRGRASSPDISVALGNLGDLQIELIEQHNDEPSPYRHFLTETGPGLHHISAWTATYDNDLARLRDRGREPDCEGKIAGLSRFAYFESDATDGSAFEVSDLGTEHQFGAFHDLIREASIGWDGSDPVRSLI